MKSPVQSSLRKQRSRIQLNLKSILFKKILEKAVDPKKLQRTAPIFQANTHQNMGQSFAIFLGQPILQVFSYKKWTLAGYTIHHHQSLSTRKASFTGAGDRGLSFWSTLGLGVGGVSGEGRFA